MDYKRKNFSDLETNAFLLCLDRFKPFIEKKKTDAITNRQKQDAWNELTAMYNSCPGVAKRNAKQLINFYKNHKKRKGKRIQQDRRVQIIKTEEEPNVNASSDPVDRLWAVSALKTLINNSVNKTADHNKITTSDTTHSENSCDQEESHEIIEVKSAAEDTAKCLYVIESTTLTDHDVPVASIPEIPSQDIISPSFQSQVSLQTIPSPAINLSNTAHRINIPSKKVYMLRRGKGESSASAKVADSVIQQSELKKNVPNEQPELEQETFNMEKEEFSMKKEKHLLEMRLLKEQVKMYELINEKIEKGEGIQICVNVNK